MSDGKPNRLTAEELDFQYGHILTVCEILRSELEQVKLQAQAEIELSERRRELWEHAWSERNEALDALKPFYDSMQWLPDSWKADCERATEVFERLRGEKK